MQLHEAIKKARKELGLTQQKLAELADIERKQLSILENGGNVTLATIRKIVAHLPNMEPFTIGQTMGTVFPAMSPQAKADVAEVAAQTLGTLLRTLLGALAAGRLPNEEDAKVLDEGNRAIYRSAGYTDEEYEQMRAATLAKLPPQQKATKKEAAATVAKITEALSQLKFDPEDEK